MLRETQASVDLDPLSAQIMSIHVVALSGAGRSEEAVVARARAIALDPRNQNARLNGIEVLFQTGRAREALADLDAAEQVGASRLRTISLRVTAHLELADTTAARAELQDLVARLGEEARSQHRVADAYMTIGDRDAALTSLERASRSFQWQMPSREGYLASPLWAPIATSWSTSSNCTGTPAPIWYRPTSRGPATA